MDQTFVFCRSIPSLLCVNWTHTYFTALNSIEIYKYAKSFTVTVTDEAAFTICIIHSFVCISIEFNYLVSLCPFNGNDTSCHSFRYCFTLVFNINLVITIVYQFPAAWSNIKKVL